MGEMKTRTVNLNLNNKRWSENKGDVSVVGQLSVISEVNDRAESKVGVRIYPSRQHVGIFIVRHLENGFFGYCGGTEYYSIFRFFRFFRLL